MTETHLDCVSHWKIPQMPHFQIRSLGDYAFR